MNKVRILFGILCTMCLVSCGGGNPQGIVEKYYTLIKQGNYEKVAEVIIDNFWEYTSLDKSEIDEHREELINKEVYDLLKKKEKDLLPKDFTIVDVITEIDKTWVKVREMYLDNDYDRVYKFIKEDGKWVVVGKEYVSEAGRADAWYKIKDDDAKVTLYSAPDTGSEVGGYINNKKHIKGHPTRGYFKVQKTDIEGWSTVVRDIWEFPEREPGYGGMGVYKGDVTYYVNRAELTENAKPER